MPALTKTQIQAAKPLKVLLTFIGDLNVVLVTYRLDLDIADRHLALPVELFRGAACELTTAQSRKALGLKPGTPLMQFALCE